ncbi:AAA family ATPase [Streptomyces sp. DSM 44915]|uniref:AAA family ATPase n=1 Tax=Streptomyces chisholmiae TaxID=3075540 RepID=A0ABU2JY23_9ACTN|nr:AAA family ATPase [Streptomyces sp. DSM 44915]MDT0269653.1 AAA family ATPase [Streptomyces sp. DSM 44915]
MDLIGRERESALLDALLDRAARGRGGAAILTGPVGCGKTALLQAFAERAAAGGALVLRVACAEAERGMPFSALAQAFQQAPIPPEHLAGLRELAPDEDCLSFLGHQADGLAERLERVYPPVVHGLWQALRALGVQAPVALVIDDIDRSDELSLRAWSFLARRVGSGRVALVAAAQTDTRRAGHFLRAEVLGQPGWQRLRLAPLSVTEVAAVLSRRLGHGQAAPAWHAVSGGSPLLLQALLDDHPAPPGPPSQVTGPEHADAPVAGPAFAEAVAACLHRCDPAAARVAEASAALGEHAGAALVADLLGTPTETVRPWLRALEAAGVLADGRFPQPAGRAAALAPLTPERSADLHRRAAERLYHAGAPPTAVAEALRSAAGEELPGWSGAVLREAGRRELAAGRSDRGAGYLELACRAATGPPDRVAALTLLTAARWRTDPAGCARHVDRLLTIARDGGCEGAVTPAVAAVTPAVDYLLWRGRFADAELLLGRLAPPDGAVASHLRAESRLLRLRLRYRAPGWLARLSPGVLDDTPADGSEPALGRSPQVIAGRALASLLAGGDPDETAEHAERVLRDCPLGDDTAEPLFTMLAVLVDLDRPAAALPRCEALLAEAERLGATAWGGRLLDLRAAIALRLADFPGAAGYARRALAVLPVEHGGPFRSGPLATLLLTHTALGQHDEAAALLARPLPEAGEQTTAGLRYAYARGLHQLATGRPEAAATTFVACGEQAVAWRLDLPALLPWRTGLAHALLRSGQPEQAGALLREQLDHAAAGPPRVRGQALRLLARTVEPAARTGLLRAAVEELGRCPAPLDQARALLDLGRALHRLGELERARAAVRRARLLADAGETDPDGTGWPPATGPARGARAAAALSDAERRVAALAARGTSNQRIAGELAITVSTVEQHLTRVYRKLGVRRRTELPTALELLAVDSALLAVDGAVGAP